MRCCYPGHGYSVFCHVTFALMAKPKSSTFGNAWWKSGTSFLRFFCTAGAGETANTKAIIHVAPRILRLRQFKLFSAFLNFYWQFGRHFCNQTLLCQSLSRNWPQHEKWCFLKGSWEVEIEFVCWCTLLSYCGEREVVFGCCVIARWHMSGLLSLVILSFAISCLKRDVYYYFFCQSLFFFGSIIYIIYSDSLYNAGQNGSW